MIKLLHHILPVIYCSSIYCFPIHHILLCFDSFSHILPSIPPYIAYHILLHHGAVPAGPYKNNDLIKVVSCASRTVQNQSSCLGWRTFQIENLEFSIGTKSLKDSDQICSQESQEQQQYWKDKRLTIELLRLSVISLAFFVVLAFPSAHELDLFPQSEC